MRTAMANLATTMNDQIQSITAAFMAKIAASIAAMKEEIRRDRESQNQTSAYPSLSSNAPDLQQVDSSHQAQISSASRAIDVADSGIRLLETTHSVTNIEMKSVESVIKEPNPEVELEEQTTVADGSEDGTMARSLIDTASSGNEFVKSEWGTRVFKLNCETDEEKTGFEEITVNGFTWGKEQTTAYTWNPLKKTLTRRTHPEWFQKLVILIISIKLVGTVLMFRDEDRREWKEKGGYMSKPQQWMEGLKSKTFTNNYEEVVYQLIYTLVRKDGMKGSPESILSGPVEPGEPKGVELTFPECYESKGSGLGFANLLTPSLGFQPIRERKEENFSDLGLWRLENLKSQGSNVTHNFCWLLKLYKTNPAITNNSINETVKRELVESISNILHKDAIAKQKASILLERQVEVIKTSRLSPSLPDILSGVGHNVAGSISILDMEIFSDLAIEMTKGFPFDPFVLPRDVVVCTQNPAEHGILSLDSIIVVMEANLGSSLDKILVQLLNQTNQQWKNGLSRMT